LDESDLNFSEKVDVFPKMDVYQDIQFLRGAFDAEFPIGEPN